MNTENRLSFKEGDLGLTKNDLDLTKESIVRIGSWEIHTFNEQRILSEEIQKQALDTVDQWVGVFPKEPTWIQKNFGIPSLIIRIDGVDKDKKLGIYEIEERPAGIGHTILINPEFAKRFEKLKATWPDFDVAISPFRDPEDDKLWNSVVSMQSAKKLVYVRAEPEEIQFRSLQDRSVSTIATEGDKSYGVPLGFWKFIEDPNNLPSNESFVLKPLQSSKGRNMIFYDMEKRPGHRRLKGVKRFLEDQIEKKGGMFIQKLIPPMESGIDTHPFMIYRFFFGFNFSTREWVSLGGSWFARNNLKIHGASDSLSGPLVST